MTKNTELKELNSDQGSAIVLTLPERAAIALKSKENELRLIELAKSTSDIVEIKNLDGRTQCHASYMTLKKERTGIEKISKAAQEDVKNFQKAIATEEERLIDLISPEETRLKALRDNWDSAEEQRKAEEARKEKERIEAIRVRLDALTGIRIWMAGKTSAELAEKLAEVSQVPDYASLDEFADKYRAMRDEVIASLELLEVNTRKTEEESAAREAEAVQMRQKLAEMRATNERLLREKQEREEADKAAVAEKNAAQYAAQNQEIRMSSPSVTAAVFSASSTGILRTVRKQDAIAAVVQEMDIPEAITAEEIIIAVADRFDLNFDEAKKLILNTDFSIAQKAAA